MSKSGQIGAVLGTDVVPPVWRFGEGYRAGALYVKPDTKVNVVYHNDVGFDKTFSDPEWGKTTALSMIDKGADVIFGAGGKTGNGALLACAEKGCYAIGVDTDQYFTVPEAQKVHADQRHEAHRPRYLRSDQGGEGRQVAGRQCVRQGRAGAVSRCGQQGSGRCEGQDRRTHQEGPELAKSRPASPRPSPPKQPAEVKKLKVGLVTDVGKVDDKSFNQSAWEGVQQAAKDLGVGSEVHRDDRPQGLCQEHRAVCG